MTAEAGQVSSPAPGGFKTLQEEISYYKAQYEHLEGELQEFQASSRELEAELEKDIEASEKRERGLKEKVEGLRFEVDEWKSKYKQSKAEANSSQNALQKEITALRDGNRTLQLKLRDIEVANDDFERQARHTTSSLEDLESKYNVALERTVMMEEEVKATEQERETLRIESQRLRDELSDLKIEAEITQEKLRSAEGRRGFSYKRVSQISDTRSQGPQSPSSTKSAATVSTDAASTPTAPQSETSTVISDAATPPSPPLSEPSPATLKPREMAPPLLRRTPSKLGSTDVDVNATPKPRSYLLNGSRPSRGPSLLPSANNTPIPAPSFSRRSGVAGRPLGVSQEPLPRSGSLYQIRGLIGKMQKLEERVHSARSKLPAPTNTPPRSSPRSDVGSGGLVGAGLPTNITMRSGRKRSTNGADSDVSSIPAREPAREEVAARRATHSRQQSRISFGLSSRESSAASRPSSRLSDASGHDAHQASQVGRGAAPQMMRPASRQQHAGAAVDARRPRSSLGGRTTPLHGHRPSVGGAGGAGAGSLYGAHAHGGLFEEEDAGHGEDSIEQGGPSTPLATPGARRATMERRGIPTPLARRQSRQMMPPERPRPPAAAVPASAAVAAHDLGETF